MNLSSLKTETDLRQIIIEELGYRATTGSFDLDLPPEIVEKVSEKKVLASHNGFEVIFVRILLNSEGNFWRKEASMRGTERIFISAIPKHERDAKLFIFCSEDGNFWHFINARSSSSRMELRRFSITPISRERLRTTQDRLALLRVAPSDTIQILIDKLKSAFDVEAVTMEFFRVFAEKFLQLAEIVEKSRTKYSYDKKSVLDVAQIILNRIIFLKFIEQKGWLDNNKNYLYDKFQPYFKDKGTYWLEIVTPLFDLLSDSARRKHQELGDIPFLNGGLFGEEPKDLFLIPIPNNFFQDLFENLLNRFNFTIEESSPNSVEVAVDPEMLGRIFEELVLRMEKVIGKGEGELVRELRRATGSYYTPRVAVFYMCREAIARRLAIQTGIKINRIKELIDFAVDEFFDEEQTDKLTLSKTECHALLDVVKEISICDPAVGSGAFLLVSLQVLVGIKRFLMFKTGHKRAKESNFSYGLKEETIKKNLIGVDILRQAVHLCELRLWLSLAVDYERQPEESIPTLPNLTYKVFQGDSIVDQLEGEEVAKFRDLSGFRADADIAQKLERIKTAKERYFNLNNEKEKEKLRMSIAKERLELTIAILEREALPTLSQADMFGGGATKPDPKKLMEKYKSDLRQALITNLKRRYAAKKYDFTSDKISFVWLVDLVEYFADHGHGGFDIVLGNPPYGLKNEEMTKGKKRYGLGSKDSYGVFMAMSFQDLLKVGGILSFITSDTWQTIKTHKPLRRFILDNAKVLNLIMMPSWLFGATVNTSILIAEKSEKGKAIFGTAKYEGTDERDKAEIIACDFTRAEKNTNELDEYLYSLDEPKEVSTPKKAIYKYKQGLIETNSNTPFFIGSPKVFLKISKISKTLVDYGKPEQGIGTGDNYYYLRKKEGARGNYIMINMNEVLSDEHIIKLSDREKIEGIDEEKYGGKRHLPYDKGGAGDTDSGWLPQYLVETDYFIDWSKQAVKRLFNVTIEDCKRRRKSTGKRNEAIRPEDKNIRAAWLPEPENWFKAGITFSRTGQYAPTFRVKSLGPFDNKSDAIVTDNSVILLGILNSKLVKYLLKTYLCHTVDTEKDSIEEIPIIISGQGGQRIESYVQQIISKQKQNPRYDYMSNEQKDIDKLVYEIYGLNKDDIREVETWYARRYPKLARFCDIN